MTNSAQQEQDTTEDPPEQQQPQVLVVLNPLAGTCTADEVREALERHFTPVGKAYEVYETTGEKDEDIAAIVRAALERDFKMVVAVGGDGTVSEVAEGLIHTETPFGIIPAGTANVLARELGIPVVLDNACALIAGEHQMTSLDAMQVGEKYYILQIGIGLDSIMIRDTERTAKRRFGRAAYLWTAFTRLMGYQPRRFTIVADGQRTRPRAAQVLIANGGVLGTPPFSWGPHISPSDGRIDVCILSARVITDYLGVVWHSLIGQQRRDRRLRYLSATRSIMLTTDRPIPVQADGEIIGETPLQVHVVPSAVRVIIPK